MRGRGKTPRPLILTSEARKDLLKSFSPSGFWVSEVEPSRRGSLGNAERKNYQKTKEYITIVKGKKTNA